jgi:hypothetical protein
LYEEYFELESKGMIVGGRDFLAAAVLPLEIMIAVSIMASFWSACINFMPRPFP